MKNIVIYDVKIGDKIKCPKTNEFKIVRDLDKWAKDKYINVWFEDNTMTRLSYGGFHPTWIEIEEKEMTNEIQQARETLKKNGYFTDNLWCIEDVQNIFDCSEEEAQDVLRETMTNEGTMHHIWSVIRIVGQDKSLKEN